MSFHLDYLLDLPGVTVETCSCIENQFTLQVRIIGEGMNCPHCGQYTEEMHQNRPILARIYLPLAKRSI
jgi:transposase-like protein